MPILSFTTIDEVPEGLRPYTKTINNKIMVDVVPTDKLTEFRTKNIDLVKDLQTQTTANDRLVDINERLIKIVGDDPEFFEQRLTELRGLERACTTGVYILAEQVETMLQRRTEDMSEGYQARLKAADDQISRLTEIVGEDPDIFKAVLRDLRETQKAFNDGLIVPARKVEEELVRRTEQMRKSYEEAMASLVQDNAELRELVKQVVNFRSLEDDLNELTRIRDLVFPA